MNSSALTYAAVLLSASALTSCSLSFSNVNTRGTASDVVDSAPANDVTASPTVTVPISALQDPLAPALVPTSHTVHTETHTVHAPAVGTAARPIALALPAEKKVTVQRVPVTVKCPPTCVDNP